MHAILLFRIFSRLLLNQSFRLSAFGIFFFFALMLLLLLLLPRSLSASSSHRFDSLNYNQYVCDYEYQTRYCPPVLILFFKIIRYTIFAILSLYSHTLFHTHTLFSSSYVFFYLLLLLLLFHGHWNFVRFLLFNFFFFQKHIFFPFWSIPITNCSEKSCLFLLSSLCYRLSYMVFTVMLYMRTKWWWTKL